MIMLFFSSFLNKFIILLNTRLDKTLARILLCLLFTYYFTIIIITEKTENIRNSKDIFRNLI